MEMILSCRISIRRTLLFLKMKLFSFMMVSIAVASIDTVQRISSILNDLDFRSLKGIPPHVSLDLLPVKLQPFMKVAFVSEATDFKGYAAMIDTSTSISYATVQTDGHTQSEGRELVYTPSQNMEIAQRPAFIGEGFSDTLARVESEKIYNFTIGTEPPYSWYCESIKTVSDTAILFSGETNFAFSVSLDLVKRCERFVGEQPPIPQFVIGASRGSVFAYQAGLFALIGPKNQMLIGKSADAVAESFCYPGTSLKFSDSLDQQQWVLAGNMRVLNKVAGIRILIDTGHVEKVQILDVAPDQFALIESLLIKHGASLIEGNTYTNCRTAIPALPIIRIQFGTSLITRTYHPKDYIEQLSNGRMCVLKLVPSNKDVTTIVAGMNILRGLVTVFDQRNGQIGICEPAPFI